MYIYMITSVFNTYMAALLQIRKNATRADAKTRSLQALKAGTQLPSWRSQTHSGRLCLSLCIYTYTYTHIHIYLYRYVYIDVYTYSNTYTHIYIHIKIHINIHKNIHINIHITFVFMYHFGVTARVGDNAIAG